MAGNQGNNRIVWTDEMIQFLKDNFYSMTNPQLAEKLGLKITATRLKCYELGLKRIEMEYWTQEQIEYLKSNYNSMGNSRLAMNLNQLYPKKKKWTRNHISKKMKYLGLKRTPEEVLKIRSFESSKGGLTYTIHRNSSSLNMHPGWVVLHLAWRDKKAQQELIKHPELIELKKQQLTLNRELKSRK